MKKIQWTSELELGIPPIDKQHKRIVTYINQLQDINQNKDKEKLGAVINELVDYTLSHFAFEEELMEESNYMFINAHKRVHNLFVRKVSSYVERFGAGEDISAELLVTLKTWLINHIKNDDRDYSKIVRKKMEIIPPKQTWISRFFKKLLV